MMDVQQECRHGRTLTQGCRECLGPDDWHLVLDLPLADSAERRRQPE